ncbi:MAG: porphobilinogen synthase [Legionellales bacterium]|nr:porphobilinogen synthase [Legionellales bacterium]|tara:strand:- start:1960 stop:2916 length:957 start_codon:yes stop_codon:yes gene_type:complete
MNAGVRAMQQEVHIRVEQLVQPIFIKAGMNIKNEIASMPGIYQYTLDNLPEYLLELNADGVKNIILFGIPEDKDAQGSAAWQADGIVQQAIKVCKSILPEMVVIADCCFCEYTDHGHCGVISETTGCPDVDNDATLTLLAKQAVSLVKAGADIIAPSGAMDGMVYAIRTALDKNAAQHIPIMSYSMKYASHFYGPFRDAAEGAPQFGDRRTYQADFANVNEALREAALDIEEGTDFLMVKPAMPYLDILYKLKQAYPEYPMVAYQVSGEYAMIQAAAQNGWLDGEKTMFESLIAIKRAGADIIITYFAQAFCARYAKI